MRLRLLKRAAFAPHNRAETPGNEFECSEEKGRALVAAGLAEELKPQPKAQPKRNGNKKDKSAD